MPPEDGGGFLALAPNLPRCMSDGESPEQAVANVQDTIETWIEAAPGLGRAVPTPSRHLTFSQSVAGDPL